MINLFITLLIFTVAICLKNYDIYKISHSHHTLDCDNIRKNQCFEDDLFWTAKL